MSDVTKLQKKTCVCTQQIIYYLNIQHIFIALVTPVNSAISSLFGNYDVPIEERVYPSGNAVMPGADP